ncbi:hypothetical protein [Cellulomonas bogoriensis]|uniref:Adhesin domain-containing protein n=1 Tax=Cellulomonas bogoriensis 69B4 = DSM 16987 TaxID=1386082 RepID=A0A0A0BNV5_9CELL|nr:hypothetical protein [Cellulomonas bogoriensis]KGM09641.1 hypothetical protein N869_06375 [Cellulomonas bogoriensis 69B4 = DSM 16987]
MTRTLPTLATCALALGLVACTPDGADEPLTVPRGDADTAVLQLTGGAGSILVSAGADTDHLLEAEAVGAAPPEHTESDGTHVLTLDGDTTTVRLSDDVRWELDVRAGADDVDVDLPGTHLSRLVLSGGAGSISLTLGEPDTVVLVEETAGADRLAVRRPATVDVRVNVTSGVGQATVDGVLTEGVGAGTDLTTDGFDESSPFYDVTVAGGLGRLDIDTT